MKKAILSIAIFTIALISSTETFAQKFPKMDASPMDASSYPVHWKNANKLVKVVYSRPQLKGCLLYTSPSPRDGLLSRMPSSA